jgi:hypothetical protein
MQQHYLARLALPTYEPSQNADEISIIVMAFFAFIVALTLVGFVLYLFISGALHTFHLRPFRFAMYILLFICAMTLGIGLIQQTRS